MPRRTQRYSKIGDTMKTIDLSGKWNYKTDIDNGQTIDSIKFENNNFNLPGSTCDNRIGKKTEYFDKISKEAVRAPRERYEYIAPLWLQKTVNIPNDTDGKTVRLFMERVNIASELWIDGVKTDRQIIELSTPHIYNLTGKITPGEHMFTLKIDNRNLLNLDTMASGYSVDTQGYWNGVIGRIELQYEEKEHIDSIQVYTDDKGITLKVVETSDVHSPFKTENATITVNVTSPKGDLLGEKIFETKVFNSKQVDYFRYDISKIDYWDEFNPNLYTATVKYECNGHTDIKSVKFGMRTIKTENKKILLNNRQISLRGTIDCAIYPLTGYPPMDIEVWRKNFKTIKSYGLNHVRFHAWCPPECAFNAADEIGMYISIEMPLWLNHDVCALETGEDPIHRQYFMQEAINISKTYGNHPSFIMFSNGNENMGDFDMLNDITTCIKAYDNRRIYTLTTNFDHPIMPCEDYLCAYEAGGHNVRIQNCQDKAAENTSLDYSSAVKDVPVPIISFEVGQYCVYPDVDLIEKYTGNILPVNLDAIKKFMIEKNVYHKLNDYIKASGDLAVKLYKEDIEAALRTKDFGGFELLSLSDYTGQSTATVGILDVFYESKGLISHDEFKNFAGEAVPLFKAKRIFKNTDTLEAELDLYDFGEKKINNPVYNLTVQNGKQVFYKTSTTESKVSIPLNSITKSTMLSVILEVNGYKNTWRIFVFAENKIENNVRMIKSEEELDDIIKNGGKAIVTKECFKNPIHGSFIPVFWSPVHFPSQKPCGAIIDNNHRIFDDFPTEKYPDYQWKRLLDNSIGTDISKFAGEVKPIIETVPNFFDNTASSPLFETEIGKAKLLFCGFDLDGDYPECKQLLSSITQYVNSDKF